MSTAGVSGLLWKARTLAVSPPLCAEAGTAKARTRAAARIAPTRTRSLATTTSCNEGLGMTRTSGPARDRLQGIERLGGSRGAPGLVLDQPRRGGGPTARCRPWECSARPTDDLRHAVA